MWKGCSSKELAKIDSKNKIVLLPDGCLEQKVEHLVKDALEGEWILDSGRHWYDSKMLMLLWVCWICK